MSIFWLILLWLPAPVFALWLFIDGKTSMAISVGIGFLVGVAICALLARKVQ